MDKVEVVRQRLRTQRVSGARMSGPADVVAWLGAVQAQEYGPAKWSVGQRVDGCTDADVERAFTDGSILRTHVLRPTWHFVVPADIRWMLTLTAPRVHALNAYYYRQLDLDEQLRKKSEEVLARALQGGNQFTRAEMAAALEQAGITTRPPLKLPYLLMNAELNQIVCSGPRRGKQHTYMLLDERVPAASAFSRDESLAILVERFFASHGPATARDFAKWSSLPVTDAKRGIDVVGPRLSSTTIDGRQHWWSASAPGPDSTGRTGSSRSTGSTGGTDDPSAVYLLADYDESFVGYRDVNLELASGADTRGAELVRPVVRYGRVVGNWRRVVGTQAVDVDVTLFVPARPEFVSAVESAVERYGVFLGLTTRLSVTS